jgi:hypothetical protein
MIKEPKNIDLTVKSEPWTEKELAEFREIMHSQKLKKRKKKIHRSTKSKSSSSVAARH